MQLRPQRAGAGLERPVPPVQPLLLAGGRAGGAAGGTRLGAGESRGFFFEKKKPKTPEDVEKSAGFFPQNFEPRSEILLNVAKFPQNSLNLFQQMQKFASFREIQQK